MRRAAAAALLFSVLLALPGRSAGQRTTGVAADSAAVAQTLTMVAAMRRIS